MTKKAKASAEERGKIRVDRVFDKVCEGWVIWTREKTPMEDGHCTVHRAYCDAQDELRDIYGLNNYREHLWRIQPVTLGATRPSRKR